MYPSLLIHSSSEGPLGSFWFGAIINKATTNICVQVFAWTYTFISLGWIPKSEIAGSCIKRMFIRNSLLPPAIYESPSVWREQLVLTVVRRAVQKISLILCRLGWDQKETRSYSSAHVGGKHSWRKVTHARKSAKRLFKKRMQNVHSVWYEEDSEWYL